MGILKAPIALDSAAGGGFCIARTDLNLAHIIVLTTRLHISRGINEGPTTP
jgi:hypothetical protein